MGGGGVGKRSLGAFKIFADSVISGEQHWRYAKILSSETRYCRFGNDGVER